MALTKITPQMFDTSAAGHDFNIDNGTFVVDASANRVGIGTTTPNTLLDVDGTATATTFVGALTGNVTGNVTGTILTAAQTNITSLGTLTALTVDDITIDGSTISDGANLTFDVAGQIILDADSGGDILLKDGGTDYGKFSILNGDWVLTQPTANKDILFKGNDGNALTALTLDMSNAGDATFNRAVMATEVRPSSHLVMNSADNQVIYLGAGNDLQIYHDGSNSYIKDAGTGALRIAGSQVILRNAADSGHMLRADDGGAVGLYHNSSSKLETTSTGVTVAGVIGLTSYIDFGTSGNRGKAGFDSNNLYIGSTSSTGEIHFKNNIGSTDAPHSSGDTKMIIGDSGVGIGTTNPGALFNVDVGAPSSSDQTLGLFQSQTARQIGFVWDDSASTLGVATITAHDLVFHTSGNSSEKMRITTGGDVSVGSDHAGFSGWRVLNIRGQSTGGMLNFENSSGTRSFTFANQGSGMRYQAHISGGYHRFETNSASNALYITDAGNVGIGTASPFGTTSNRVCLSVNGTSSISINGGVGGSQKIYVYADANQGEISTVGNIPLRLGNNGGPRMAVTSAGLIPHVADTYDLGSTAYRWANGYFNDFHLSNEGTNGNDVDGTTGDWTIQEGKEHLYIINNKSGKKFRFALEEVT